MSGHMLTIIGGVAVGVILGLFNALIALAIGGMKRDNERRDQRLNNHSRELQDIRRDYVRRDDHSEDIKRIEGKLDHLITMLSTKGVKANGGS